MPRNSIKAIIATFLFKPCNLLASFEVRGPQWPDVPQINTETKEYNKNLLSPQLSFIDSFIRKMDGIYLKVGGYLGNSVVGHWLNKSNSITAEFTTIKTYAYKQHLGIEFAGGIVKKPWRVELEYIYNPKIQVNIYPVFTGRTEQLISRARNRSIHLISYYEFIPVGKVIPYIGLSLSLNMNNTRSKIMGGLGDNLYQVKSNVSPGYGLLLGMHYHINQKYHIYAGYRYINFGKFIWQSKYKLFSLQASYYLHGINLGAKIYFNG